MAAGEERREEEGKGGEWKGEKVEERQGMEWNG